MRKIDKLAMAKGYEEMADINLQIAQEYFYLETEGEIFNEMDRKGAEDKAE